MFRFEFTCQNHLIERYTYGLSFITLLLTFFKQTNVIHYLGATYVIGSIAMTRLDHLRNAIAISGTGCAFDFLHIILYSSSSESPSVRFALFFVRLCAFLFEVMWTMCVHCYRKQQIAIKAAEWLERKQVKKVTWCEDQLRRRKCSKMVLLDGTLQSLMEVALDVARAGAKAGKSTVNQLLRSVKFVRSVRFNVPKNPMKLAKIARLAKIVKRVKLSKSTRLAKLAKIAKLAITEKLAELGKPVNLPRRSIVVDDTSAVAKSANVELPIAEPANVEPVVAADLPTAEPANVDVATAEPANVDVATAEPANADLPTAELANKESSDTVEEQDQSAASAGDEDNKAPVEK